MGRTERQPKASNVLLPVYVPSTNGATEIELGKASLKAGTLVIEFKNNLPGVAIQRMIERGVVLGLSFVMLAEDETHQRAMMNHEAAEAALAEQAETETEEAAEIEDAVEEPTEENKEND